MADFTFRVYKTLCILLTAALLVQLYLLRRPANLHPSDNAALQATVAKTEQPTSPAETARARTPQEQPLLTKEELETKAYLAELLISDKLSSCFFGLRLTATNSNSLNPSIAQALKLDGQQEEKIQSAIESLIHSLAQLRSKNSKLSRPDDETILVSISPFPNEGQQAYNAFLEQSSEIIGPSKTTALDKLLSFSKSWEFYDFGQYPLALQVTHLGYHKADGMQQASYEMNVIYDKGDSWGNSVTQGHLSNIEGNVPATTHLLPPEEIRAITTKAPQP